LIYAKENIAEPMPDELNIDELVAHHFPNAKLLRFGASPRKYFINWMIENKAGILVSGSFGKAGLSRLFHKSFVAEVIKEHKIPLFIAHQ
jgi:nucleotide-binding universal stress UspA family protein